MHFIELTLAEEQEAAPLLSLGLRMQIVLICQRATNRAQRSDTASRPTGTVRAQLRSCSAVPQGIEAARLVPSAVPALGHGPELPRNVL